MSDLSHEARDLVEHPARRPAPVEALVERIRRRKRRQAAVGVTAALLLGGGAAGGLVATGSPRTPPTHVGVAGPSSPHPLPSSLSAPPTPPGYVRVDYRDASVAVPGSWRLVNLSAGCPDRFEAVVLGATTSHCAAYTGPVFYVQVAPLTQAPPPGEPVVINGLAGTRLSGRGGDFQEVAFPQLGVTVSAAGGHAAALLQTVGWSSGYLALHPRRPVRVPVGWKAVSFDGIQVRVPPSWPTQRLTTDATDPGACGGIEFPSPRVVEGRNRAAYNCAFLSIDPVAGVDGVWIRRGQGAGDLSGASPVIFSHLPLVALAGGGPASQPVLHLVATAGTNQVAVDIGLGPDPAVAQAVIASLAPAPRG